MKCLHIHTSFSSGGIEAMVCNIANEMSNYSDVSVCSIFKPEQKHIFWYKLDSKVKRLSIGKRTPGFSLIAIWKIYTLIKNQNFDVVYLHGFIQYYLIAIFFLHKRVRFFYTLHSMAAQENSHMEKKIFALKKFLFKNSWVKPICISESTQYSFKKLYDCRSHLIHNGIPTPKVELEPIEIANKRFTSNTKILFHAGRISEAKNQQTLCKIVKRLIEEGEDIVLLIAGPVDDTQIFDRLKPLFCDRIEYIGTKTNISSYLAYSDALCLPSKWEGLPVVLLEALSVGCIPICSPVGGCCDVIKSEANGFLSDTCNEIDYYDAVKRFLALDRKRLKSLEANVKSTFVKYKISICAKKYYQVALENEYSVSLS